MFNNYAVIYEKLKILSGSMEFFKFVGTLTFDSLLSKINDNDIQFFKDTITDLINDGTKKEISIELIDDDGTNRPCYIILSPLNDFGERKTFLLNVYDIKQTVEDVSVLKRRTELLQMTVDPDKNIVFEYTPTNDHMYIYRCSSLNAYTIYDGSLSDWSDFILKNKKTAPESETAFHMFISDLKRNAGVINSEISLDLFNDGSVKPYIIEGFRIVDNTSVQMTGGTISYKDVTNRADILTDFTYDYMTGVLDKRSIVKYAKDRIETRTNQSVILAILDLDFFKDVNDVLGHSTGDSVIIEFSKIISSCIKDAGAVGRFGGDEFMVILDNVSDVAQIKEYFKAIRITTERTFKKIGTKTMNVTTSIGVVPADNLEDDISYGHMFQIADACLYMAKEYGRNRYIIYDDRSKKLLRIDGNVTHGKFEKNPQSSKYVMSLTQRLFDEGVNAIEPTIHDISEKYGIDNIVIYLKDGEEYKPQYIYGNVEDGKKNIDYIFADDYFNKFDENGCMVVFGTASLEMRMPNVYRLMREQSINACIHYLMKKGDELIGVISYEICLDPSRYWQDYEIFTLVILSQIMSLVIQNDQKSRV